MHPPTELHISDVAALYRKFSFLVGSSSWESVVKAREIAAKGNQLLQDYHRKEWSVAYELYVLGQLIARGVSLPEHGDQLRPLYGAISFMLQASHQLQAWPAVEAERLRHRIHAALDKPDEMRGLRLELAAATHFSWRRWKIEWPEVLANPGETFDLLVTPPGGPQVEVECKSVGEDKGRRITRLEAINFIGLLLPHIKPYEDQVTASLSVRITIPGRLPKATPHLRELAQEVGRALIAGQNTVLSDGTMISISDFDRSLLPRDIQKAGARELRDAFDRISMTRNRTTMVIGSKAGGVTLLSLQSAKEDNMMKVTMDTLSDASSRQLTKRRAGLLIASLEGLDSNSLLNVAQDDKVSERPYSKLQTYSDMFLRSDRRDHIVGLAFWSRMGQQALNTDTMDATGGSAYHFPRRISPFWHDSYDKMFAQRT